MQFVPPLHRQQQRAEFAKRSYKVEEVRCLCVDSRHQVTNWVELYPVVRSTPKLVF